ncbi:hypothetical protein CF327_g7164 [Tilletia walkeri]|uniref:Uncharacterized protein n=1 Tax=Tilletia walkeri TaxID=117179 RepID=A0A8X7N482_9BASI|nr:hypothetical protein CF327_g7164 [Tilletia walkeri]KAE8264650.1 hypothetical protein A4X09_0g6902 [Tilletia walkeri]
MVKHGPEPERLNVGGDTIIWTDTGGAGPLGPAMKIRLLMLSFQHLEGQVSEPQIAHVAQQMVPSLASDILSHLTGGSLEDREALIGDPRAVEYERMVFPFNPELLRLKVRSDISTKELSMLRQLVDTQTSEACDCQSRTDEL